MHLLFQSSRSKWYIFCVLGMFNEWLCVTNIMRRLSTELKISCIALEKKLGVSLNLSYCFTRQLHLPYFSLQGSKSNAKIWPLVVGLINDLGAHKHTKGNQKRVNGFFYIFKSSTRYVQCFFFLSLQRHTFRY